MDRLFRCLLTLYVTLMPIVMISSAVNMFALSLVHRIYAAFLIAMSALTYVILGLAARVRKLDKALYFLTVAQSVLVLATILLTL